MEKIRASIIPLWRSIVPVLTFIVASWKWSPPDRRRLNYHKTKGALTWCNKCHKISANIFATWYITMHRQQFYLMGVKVISNHTILETSNNSLMVKRRLLQKERVEIYISCRCHVGTIQISFFLVCFLQVSSKINA